MGGAARDHPAHAARASGRQASMRVWSAGCASGEEAFSLAMCLAEVLGVEAFRARVKIYATDVDEEALAIARHGDLRRPRLSRAFRANWRTLLRADNGPSARRSARTCVAAHLRPQRPRAGRADLAHRPAGVSQHADVLQRRDAGADPAAPALRAARRRGAVLGKAEMWIAHARPVRGRGPEAAVLPQGRRPTAAGPVRDRATASRRGTDGARAECARGARSTAPSAQIVVDRRAAGAGEPTGRRAVRAGSRGHRPAVPGPGALLPAGRPPLAHRQALAERRAGGREGRGVAAGRR